MRSAATSSTSSSTTPGQRKAAIETGIAEIKIDGDQIIPIFKIPTQPDHDGADSAVRAMTPMVGRRGLEPRTRRLKVSCSTH